MIWMAMLGVVGAAGPHEQGPLALRELGWGGEPVHAAEPLEAFESPYDSPDDLPDVVYIRTPYQTFNNHHYFALVGGRIWEKDRSKTATGEPEVVSAGGWHLMEETGLPWRPGKVRREVPRFVKVGQVLAIVADDDEIIALGANQRVYWKRDGATRRFDDQWYDLWGFPLRGRFYWPEEALDFKGWGVGRRRLESTGYFTDIDGNEHVSGFGITTTYVLDDDGHTIWFADTGLPPRLSHRICGPERDRMVLEGLDASASTMMLIDDKGNVFTRLADYDTQGGTPGHRYSYERVGLDDLDPFDPRTIDTNMSLPGEDWMTHAPVTLSGHGAVTSDITILQTGLGNDARELRIAGRGPEGQPGYYWKALLDEAWRFREAPISVAELGWLQQDRLGEPPQLVESKDIAMRGHLVVKGLGTFEVSVPDFNRTCTPATVDVTVGATVVPLELHLVDSWTPFREPDPGYDGTTKGSLGTLTQAEGAPEPTDPEALALLEALEPQLLDTYGLWVEANHGYAEARSVGMGKRGDVTLLVATEGATPQEVELTKEKSLTHTSFLEATQDPELIIADLASADTWQLQQVIDANEALADRISDLKHKQQDKRAGSIALSGAMIGVNVVMRATGLRLIGRIGDKRRPHVKHPTKVGVWFSKVTYVLENTASMVIRATRKDARTLRSMRTDHAMAMDVLGERLRAYEAELARRQR